MKFSVCIRCNLAKERQKKEYDASLQTHQGYKHQQRKNYRLSHKSILAQWWIGIHWLWKHLNQNLEKCLIVTECVLSSALIEIGLVIPRKKHKN